MRLIDMHEARSWNSAWGRAAQHEELVKRKLSGVELPAILAMLAFGVPDALREYPTPRQLRERRA